MSECPKCGADRHPNTSACWYCGMLWEQPAGADGDPFYAVTADQASSIATASDEGLQELADGLHDTDPLRLACVAELERRGAQ